MIRVRKMIPGETRTYNGATRIVCDSNGALTLSKNDLSDVVAVVSGDVVMEFDSPCRVHYSKPKGRKPRR